MTAEDREDSEDARDEMLAGEYVLGVLSSQARLAVERRMTVDRAFQQRVAAWQSDFAPLDDQYQDATPAPAVFGRIEQRLFGAPPAAAPTGLWDAAAFWRRICLGTSLAAIAAIVYASGIIAPPQAGRNLTAELSSPGNPVKLLASFDATSGRLRLIPAAAGQAGEKSLQLWLVEEDGVPRPLGVFQPGADGELLIPADLRATVGEGATLAVSLEPFGGSPTGLPTGPIVASGTTRQL